MAFYTDFPKYPTSIFDDTDYPDQADSTDTVYAALVNALKEELQACFAELGTLPKGDYINVKARLDASVKKIEDADGDTSWNTEETSDKDEIQGRVKGVEFFRGHDDGIITLAKQSGARANGADVAQIIPNETNTKITLKDEDYDIQGEFDPVTLYRFTAKKAGYYLVIGNVGYINIGADKKVRAMIYKNGALASFAQIETSVVGYFMVNVSDILHLAVDGFFELWTWHNHGGNITITGAHHDTFMSIHKLS